jgi:hypothetical protein
MYVSESDCARVCLSDLGQIYPEGEAIFVCGLHTLSSAPGRAIIQSISIRNFWIPSKKIHPSNPKFVGSNVLRRNLELAEAPLQPLQSLP